MKLPVWLVIEQLDVHVPGERRPDPLKDQNDGKIKRLGCEPREGFDDLRSFESRELSAAGAVQPFLDLRSGGVHVATERGEGTLDSSSELTCLPDHANGDPVDRLDGGARNATGVAEERQPLSKWRVASELLIDVDELDQSLEEVAEFSSGAVEDSLFDQQRDGSDRLKEIVDVGVLQPFAGARISSEGDRGKLQREGEVG